VCASWPLITRRGEIAIVSQSGTVGAALIDWTYEERLGFSAFVREAPGDHPLPLHRRQPPQSHRGHRRRPLPERARRGRGGVRRGDDDLRGPPPGASEVIRPGRCQLVILTEEGKGFVEPRLARHIQRIGKYFSPLTDLEKEILLKILTKLRRKIA